jgi:hypothetical protein
VTTVNTKPWYRSKTIWGAIITGIATILNITGQVNLDLTEQAQITDGLVAVGSLVGVILAIIGRVKAKQKIK